MRSFLPRHSGSKNGPVPILISDIEVLDHFRMSKQKKKDKKKRRGNLPASANPLPLVPSSERIFARILGPLFPPPEHYALYIPRATSPNSKEEGKKERREAKKSVSREALSHWKGAEKNRVGLPITDIHNSWGAFIHGREWRRSCQQGHPSATPLIERSSREKSVCVCSSARGIYEGFCNFEAVPHFQVKTMEVRWASFLK